MARAFHVIVERDEDGDYRYSVRWPSDVRPLGDQAHPDQTARAGIGGHRQEVVRVCASAHANPSGYDEARSYKCGLF